MATAPWRCSQCGTINEPVANSCRTCGKWPSLFDLEDNVVEEDAVPLERVDELDVYAEPEPVQTQEAPEPVTVEVEPYEAPEAPGMPAPAESRRRFEPPPTDPVFEEGETSGPRWISWIIPLAVVVYFVISFFFSGR